MDETFRALGREHEADLEREARKRSLAREAAARPRRRALVVAVAGAVGVALTFATNSPAAPSSPGACNMLNVSVNGMDGMGRSSERGLSNMMELVAASIAAGCPK